MLKTLEDFYNDLGIRESGGDYSVINPWGFVGKYQMGESAMVDAGYYVKPSRNYNNDWTGNFTGKDGVYSLNDFRKNKQAQENAQKAFKKAQWRQLKVLGLDKYVGSEINGVKVTQSGLLAAAHLKGPGGVQEYLHSSGKSVPKDKLGTSVEHYMSKFGGYDVSEITGLKTDVNTSSFTIQNVQTSENINTSTMDLNMNVKPFQLRIEQNEYLPGYLPTFDNLYVNPIDNTLLQPDIQRLPDFNSIPMANPWATQGQAAGFAASIVEESPYQKPITFTPEQIGKMTREEFDRNESIIMEQLKRGEINPYSQQPNYDGFNNPELDKQMIFTREDIGNMSTAEYTEYEKAINEQLKTVGIPYKRDLPQNARTYEKEKSQRSYSTNSQDGRWVTINGNHVFIEND